MLIILVGPTCAGKTTLAKYMEEKHGYKRVVTYTTRPKREGEVDGVDYNFVTREVFEWMLSEGELLEHTEYNAHFGNCMYGSMVTEEDLQGKHVIVLNPDGAMAARARFKPSDIFIVYLECPEYTCVTRAKDRGDNMSEVLRRLKEDEIHSFQKFRSQHTFDLVIYGSPDCEAEYEYIKGRIEG